MQKVLLKHQVLIAKSLRLFKGTLQVSLVADRASTIQLPMRNTYVKKFIKPV